MATRYDTTVINKPQRTQEGYLFCESVFARDGILEYRLPNGGTRKELRLPETNQAEDTLVSYASKPVTIEHPPVLLDAQNSKQYQVGVSDPVPTYERKYGKGFVGGVVRIFDSAAIDLIDSGKKKEISIGYVADIDHTPGVYFPKTGEYLTGDAAKNAKGGERFDAIQRNVRVNHIALTAKGRAGSDVCLRLDSADEDVAYSRFDHNKLPTKRMTTVRLDGMEFADVPEGFAMAATQKFKELETLSSRMDSIETAIANKDSELANLKAQLEQEAQLRERERGRADALEIQLEEMRWDKKSGYDPEEEEDPEEEADETDEEEAQEDKTPPKGKGKGKKFAKKDAVDDEDEDEEVEEEDEDDEERGDSVSDRLTAWMDAEAVIPGICRTDSYNPDLSVPDIQSLVIKTFEPEVNLDSASPAYIQGRFDYWMAQQDRSGETRNDYTDELKAVTGMAQRSDRGGINSIYKSHNQEVMQNYTQPLALSKE